MTTLAIARMQDDSTAALRTLYPDLIWVWDELDMLREDYANTCEDLEHVTRRIVELESELDQLDTE